MSKEITIKETEILTAPNADSIIITTNQMSNENKTALTAEEIKGLVNSIDLEKKYPVSYTIKQDGTKVYENTFLLGRDLTEKQILQLNHFASLQTQEKDKEIERLKKYCASEGALNSVQRMKLDKVERDKIKFSEEQNIKLHEENEELIVLIESQQKDIEGLKNQESKYHFAREVIFTLKSSGNLSEKVYLHWIDKLNKDEQESLTPTKE